MRFLQFKTQSLKNHPLVQGSRVQGFFLSLIKSIGYWSLVTESREKNSETSPLWSWGVGVSKNRIFRIDSDSNKTYTNRFLDPDLWSKVPKTTAGDLRNPYLDQENWFLTLKLKHNFFHLKIMTAIDSNIHWFTIISKIWGKFLRKFRTLPIKMVKNRFFVYFQGFLKSKLKTNSTFL